MQNQKAIQQNNQENIHTMITFLLKDKCVNYRSHNAIIEASNKAFCCITEGNCKNIVAQINISEQ